MYAEKQEKPLPLLQNKLIKIRKKKNYQSIMKNLILQKRAKRKSSVRIKVKGDAGRPRLTVYRSNKYIYGQIIDDQAGRTLVSASSLDKLAGKEKIKSKIKKESNSKSAQAYEIGLTLAKKAKVKQITNVSFDRGAYKYHGRVKAFAQGAREGGLNF